MSSYDPFVQILIKSHAIAIAKTTISVIIGACLAFLFSNMTISSYEALTSGALIYILYGIGKNVLNIINAKKIAKELNVTVVSSQEELEDKLKDLTSDKEGDK